MDIFIQVALVDHKSETLGVFKRKVEVLSEIVECYRIIGDFDFLLKVRVEDMPGYRHFLGTGLLAIEQVLSARTYVVIPESKPIRRKLDSICEGLPRALFYPGVSVPACDVESLE
jgi:DNA-binding Lrp family transcriptional regulator